MYGTRNRCVKRLSRRDLPGCILGSMRSPALVALVAVLAAACDAGENRGGGAPCGIAALAGATTLLDHFSVPQRTLSVAPEALPERLVVRVAAGPAVPAIVGRADGAVIIGVDAPLPGTVQPSFGVLLVSGGDQVHGVLLYEVPTIEGAPVLGTVQVGDTAVPLLGLQAEPDRFETPGCPLFPDSLSR